jgi:hypothetical protein
MPLVLTTNALITCPHGGVGTTIPLSPIWTVNEGFVAADGDSGKLTCIFIPPCVGYTLQSMGLNATKIDGRNAMLVTDFTQSFTGLPLTIKDFHTTSDDSTPAPIPTGQSAPPPSPALADLVPPVIVATPPTMPFVLSAPAPVAFNFSLSSDYPLQWILTLINPQTGQNFDLTNGAPGVTVIPSGGSWTTPTLDVAITMTPAFLEPLLAGTSQLYMIGVSQRGTSGKTIATITITAT